MSTSVRATRVAFLAASLLLLTPDRPAAQDPGEVLRGSWTAAASSGLTVGGRWSAQARPDAAGAAYGSWTLDQAGRVVLEGTWAAEKSRTAWRGSWSARTTTGRTFSGTWEAALEISAEGGLMDMLRRSLEEQVAGSWRYGSLTGHWWLQGSTR